MPSPQSILAGLSLAATEAVGVAITWHALVLAAVLALLFGWRPSRRVAGTLLAAPIASAATVAFVFGNPFNGLLLGLLALALVGIASRLRPPQAVQRGDTVATLCGVAMIVFGWVYPHFLQPDTAVTYLIAAPTGVVPCPTLSLVIGFTLFSGGLQSWSWSLALASVGLFYGVFGVARLGVGLDLVLVAGASTLLVFTRRMRRRASHHAG